MRSALPLNRHLLIGCVSGFIFGVAVAWFAAPVYRSMVIAIYENEFASLTFKCDQAMREHWINKMSLAKKPSNEAVALLKASEIALIDCQDYDLMQKKLARLGLTETDLGELVLRATEQNPRGLKTVIDVHEIRY
ncbi:MAG: TIGR03982 family His-Xaa-Ser system protein [Pseudomonadota bacterium]